MGGAWAALLSVCALGCSSIQPLDGMDALQSANTFLRWERDEEALALAEQVLEQDADEPDAQGRTRTLEERGEAQFVAAEAALRLGRHLKAFRYYRDVLLEAPWSVHAAVIEERLYEIGLVFLEDARYGGWFDSRGRGVEVLETLQVHFRRGELADDALRHVGDYFAGEDVREWREAALVYERLYREYPDSEWAERALWLAGHCRLRLVPGPRYNRDEMLRAHELLELSLKVHPKGMASADAAEDRARVRELLARGEVLTADFYAGRGRAEGERLRLVNALLLYPDTPAGVEAGQRLDALGVDLRTLTLADGSVDNMRARPAREQP